MWCRRGGWRPQVDALARDHRVAIFDHRGIGKSELGGAVTITDMTADAMALLDALSSIPTLVVSATHDRIAPCEQGRALAGAIRGARYVEIDGAAHGVTIHNADVVNDLLREHIAAAITA